MRAPVGRSPPRINQTSSADTRSILSPSRTRALPLFMDRLDTTPPSAPRTSNTTCVARVSAGFQVATRPSSESRTGRAGSGGPVMVVGEDRLGSPNTDPPRRYYDGYL